jgi:valyl-tRNA synthetase
MNLHIFFSFSFFIVIADEYVDKEFGTGALKVTPAHDVNDYELGKIHQLPMINIMNKDATINSIGTQRYEGLDRFACRDKLWNDMAEVGLAIKVEKHTQRVPRSQRGGEIIEPMISAQWFVRMDSMAKKAVDATRDGRIKIIPQRFDKIWFNWLENIHDWCISRQLWWGHRIPVYYVKSVDGKSVVNDPLVTSNPYVVAKSVEEARQKARELYPQATSIQLQQDDDVLDTWFSSGLWPFATVGWPNTSAADFQRFYPASVLETGYDILFFWVARMVTMGMELTGTVPFHTIYMHGLVRDAQGQKMSKTKGNVIDPIDTLEQFGSDALRYTLVTGSTPGQDVPLSLERVESNRNFVNKLWNAGKYMQNCVQLVSTSSDFNWQRPTRLLTPHELSTLSLPERYIISRLHQLIHTVSAQLEAYQFGEAGRLIYEFLWDELADWYIEMSKAHIRSENVEVRQQSVRTLLYVWDLSLRLLHPYMPYITETLWQQLPSDTATSAPAIGSIMVASWPDFQSEQHGKAPFVDEDALKTFGKVQALVRAIRNARAEYHVDTGKKIAVIIRVSDNLMKVLQQEDKSLIMFGRIDDQKLEFVHWDDSQELTQRLQNPQHPEAPFVHLVVSEDLEAFLPQSGFLDREKELSRLNKQREKLLKDIASLESRLNNPNFIKKAPEHLVNDLQAKVQDFRQQLQTVASSLQTL